MNIFDLLVNNLLANTINDVTDRSFVDDWNDIKQAVPRRTTEGQVEALQERLQNFNNGLFGKLEELKKYGI